MRHYNYSFAATHALLVVLLLISSPAYGTVLGTYNDRTTWEGLTTSRVDIDFESLGIAPGGFQSHNTVAGLTHGGVDFIGYQNGSPTLYAKNPPTGDTDDFLSNTLLRGPEFWVGGCCPDGSYLIAVVPSGVTSFGLDLMSAYPAGASFRIELDSIDVGVIVVTQSRPNRTFFGVRTDAPFAQVKVIMTSGTVFTTYGLFDNVAYGSSGGGGDPGQTPEVATLLIVASGLLLFRFARRIPILRRLQPA